MGHFNDMTLSRTAEDAELDRRDGLTPSDPVTRARIAAAAPELFAALHRLVAADNCNYWRDTMRYCGMFDAARAALTLATGESYAHPDAGQTRDPLLYALLQIAEAGDDVAAIDLRGLAQQALEQAGADPLPPAIELPAGWSPPAFALGEQVYVREPLSGGPILWMITGLRWEDNGPWHSQAPQWVYRVARRYAINDQDYVTHDRREHEQRDLSRTPWCACVSFCGGVATTVIAGERYCADCAADRADELQPF